MTKQEEILQTQVTTYLKWLGNIRGEILFTSDLSGIYIKNKGYARKLARMRSRKGVPDIIIFEPRKGYHGLFLELKTEDDSPFRKDGTLRRTQHIIEQSRYHIMLRQRGYQALFVVGYNHAIKVINEYFNITNRTIRK